MNLNRRELAELLGVTPRTISAWATEPGFPQPIREGRSNAYDAHECVKWWKDREVSRLIETEDGSFLDLDQERARLARAQRLRVEQDMAVRRKELIERKPAERTMAITAGRIRDGLIVIADRLGPVVAAETDPDRVHRLMIEEIEQTLTVLADAGKELAETAEAEALEEIEHERKAEQRPS